MFKRLLLPLARLIENGLARQVEYLLAENRILRSKLPARVPLDDSERRSIAVAAAGLGVQLLSRLARIAKPDTILRWHRRLVEGKARPPANPGRRIGRPRTPQDQCDLVARLARENRAWGYRRLSHALKNLGIELSHATIARILAERGLLPAPDRGRPTQWREFLKAHWEVLAATDFFSVKVWTLRGLVTFHVLFVVRLATRKVHVAGISANPDGRWMGQIARNLTMDGWGFLEGARVLVHDRDPLFCASFREVLRGAGVDSLRLPRRSPNLNAHCERWVRTVREECLSRLVLAGEGSLRRALALYETHYNHERTHRGLGGRIPEPRAEDRPGAADGRVRRRARLGGMLNFYWREAG